MPMNPFALFVTSLLVTSAVIWIPVAAYRVIRRERLDRGDRAIAAFDFGDAARLALRRKRPELGSAQLELVWSALRDYFRVCLYGGRRLMPMPSQVVDDAWHGFIIDTPRYTQFCEAVFGRFLHHLPDASGAKVEPARRRVEGNPTWKLGRAFLPNYAPTSLPLLFAIDESLNIEDGFRYEAPDLKLLGGTSTRDGSYGCSACVGGSDSGDGGGDSGGHGGHSGCSSSGCSGGCGGGGH